MTDLEVFSRLPEHILRPWLETQRAACYKVLSVNRELSTLHQEQGKVQLVEEMLKLLDKAKGLR